MLYVLVPAISVWHHAPALIGLGALALLAARMVFMRAGFPDAFYPFAIAPTYYLLGAAGVANGTWNADGWLASLDRASGLSDLGAAPAWLLNPLVVVYWLFFALLIVALLRFSRGDAGLRESFYEGLFVVYALGYLGYLLLPAGGPYLRAEPAGGLPWSLATFSETIMRTGTNRVDAFPSLHVAVSAFIGGFYWRHCRPAFYRWLPVVVLIPPATIVLRFHYAADVIAGFFLAALGLYAAHRARPQPATFAL